MYSVCEKVADDSSIPLQGTEYTKADRPGEWRRVLFLEDDWL
jgi:hypothetical protein